MDVKILGSTYSFTLHQDGLVHCDRLRVFGKTAEEAIARAKEAVKAAKSLPRIPVLILEERWMHVIGWREGTASPIADNHDYRWVSYQKDGKPMRSTEDSDKLFRDTPENRDLVQRLVEIGKKVDALYQEHKSIKSKLVSLEVTT